MTAALILIVFAGGPHTYSRAVYARELMPSLRPDVVFLTGGDFLKEDSTRFFMQPVERPEIPPDTEIVTDSSRTTLASCLFLAREIRRRCPEGAEVAVVTSNYHAPRAMWLLRGLLPRRYSISVRKTADIRPADLRHSQQARVLIRGEAVSWLYCLPVGLLLRPVPAGLALLVAGLAARHFRGKRKVRTALDGPSHSEMQEPR